MTESDIGLLIVARRYADALQLGKSALGSSLNGDVVLNELYELTAILRSECIGLAYKKMDSGSDYQELESILRDANTLTGQDMYGRFV
jgi:hypothetical protein